MIISSLYHVWNGVEVVSCQIESLDGLSGAQSVIRSACNVDEFVFKSCQGEVLAVICFCQSANSMLPSLVLGDVLVDINDEWLARKCVQIAFDLQRLVVKKAEAFMLVTL